MLRNMIMMKQLSSRVYSAFSDLKQNRNKEQEPLHTHQAKPERARDN